MGNWAEERAMVTRKLIISSSIAGVQATCTRKKRKECPSSAEICYWPWHMRQQRIQVESHSLVRHLASFILVLIEVVGFVFVKADILWAQELGFSEASFTLVVLALKWITQFSVILYDLYLYNARQVKPIRHTVLFLAQNISQSLKIYTLLQVNLFFLFPLGLSFSSNTAPRYLH